MHLKHYSHLARSLHCPWGLKSIGTSNMGPELRDSGHTPPPPTSFLPTFSSFSPFFLFCSVYLTYSFLIFPLTFTTFREYARYGQNYLMCLLCYGLIPLAYTLSFLEMWITCCLPKCSTPEVYILSPCFLLATGAACSHWGVRAGGGNEWTGKNTWQGG